MKIRGANLNYGDLATALVEVNQKFGDNIFLSKCVRGGTGRNGKTYTVILKAYRSGGVGTHRSPQGQRTGYACWHVWKAFLKALPEGTQTYSVSGRDGKYRREWRSAHDEPVDWEVGSQNPQMMSGLCDCNRKGE